MRRTTNRDRLQFGSRGGREEGLKNGEGKNGLRMGDERFEVRLGNSANLWGKKVTWLVDLLELW